MYDYIQESMISKLKDNNLEATSSDLSAVQHAFAGALAGAAATAVRFLPQLPLHAWSEIALVIFQRI